MTTGTGFADLHLHQFADLGFGGRVLWGSPAADDAGLTSCRPRHGPHGLTDVTGNISKLVLRTGGLTALLGHRTVGTPQFPDWPAWNDLTHQSVPLSGLIRAVAGGLRLIVMLAVNNELLGRLTGGRRYHDMEAVDRQIQAAKELEAAIDTAAGGPGRGWYRIAYTPAQARRAITEGKLAVVLGVEVDQLFGGVIGQGSTTDDLAVEVDRLHALGVRHVFPLHLKDNHFGGAAFGIALQWSRRHRPFSRVNPSSSLPVFRMDTADCTAAGYDYRGGHCNVRGLTPLGEALIQLLMSHRMMIDIDHMSAASRADTLRLTGSANYPVVAGHAELFGAAQPGYRSERLLTDDEVELIDRHGGIVAPMLRQLSPPVASGSAGAFLTAYRHVAGLLPAGPIALGSDLNGFAGLPHPGTPLDYPFPAPVTGATLSRGTLGDRQFDLAADGVAQVGMLPDFLAGLRGLGLREEEGAPLLGSALSYVEAWERTGGLP